MGLADEVCVVRKGGGAGCGANGGSVSGTGGKGGSSRAAKGHVEGARDVGKAPLASDVALSEQISPGSKLLIQLKVES